MKGAAGRLQTLNYFLFAAIGTMTQYCWRHLLSGSRTIVVRNRPSSLFTLPVAFTLYVMVILPAAHAMGPLL